MITFRINLPSALITLIVLISCLESHRGALAAEQKNDTDTKPESPLWQISSTQSTIVPISPSVATSAQNSGPITLSSLLPSSSVSTLSVSQSHNLARDEIYIDDEGLEGSGGRGEIHDDLEKEPEYSGSGFGPDDEDSTSSTTHQRKKGNVGHKSSSIGNGGYQPTNSKNKDPLTDTKLNKQPEHIHTTEDNVESGSGDKDIDDNDGDDGDDDRDIDGDGDDLDQPPTHTDEGEDETGHGSILNKNNLNTSEEEIDPDEDDLTTTIDQKIEKTDDGISIDKQNPDFDRGISGGEGNEIDLDQTNENSATGKPSSGIEPNHNPTGNEVFIMDNRAEDRTASFFAQPGILAAVIGGAVVGLLCAILVVMFIVYRMRKKDEGSYALDEPKRSPAVNSYAKNANNREFYA